MTDKDIIKALECCSKADKGLYGGLTYKGESLRILIKDALDLINRQKAEIEKHKSECVQCGEKTQNCIVSLQNTIAEQKAEIERLRKAGEEAVSCFNRMESLYNIKRMELKVAKNQAITEFAETLKEHLCSYDLDNYHFFRAVEEDVIDQIAKEMKGEQ